MAKRGRGRKRAHNKKIDDDSSLSHKNKNIKLSLLEDPIVSTNNLQNMTLLEEPVASTSKLQNVTLLSLEEPVASTSKLQNMTLLSLEEPVASTSKLQNVTLLSLEEPIASTSKLQNVTLLSLEEPVASTSKLQNVTLLSLEEPVASTSKLQNIQLPSPKEPIAGTIKSSTLPRLRVLSLFDGIGTGYYALNKLNFDIEAFYASEIDKDALFLTKSHYSNNIIQLGSVVGINDKILEKIGPINLLIGGSPCSDLSNINYRKKGLYNCSGSGPLFFNYYRVWFTLNQKSIIDKQPFYWLFENVANMELKNKNTISRFFGCEPYVIDSCHLSPQKRKRFFWSNIPNIGNLQNIKKTNKDEGPLLESCLITNLERKANVKKIGTITTKRNCLQDGKSKNPVSEQGNKTGLYITELELIFGFSSHYTDVGDFLPTKRQKLLGKAWSAQVIQSIFELLADDFARK